MTRLRFAIIGVAAIFIGIMSGILAGLFKHYVLKQHDEVSV